MAGDVLNMDADFAKYLRDFLKRYGIDFYKIDFDQVRDYRSLKNKQKTVMLIFSPFLFL